MNGENLVINLVLVIVTIAYIKFKYFDKRDKKET